MIYKNRGMFLETIINYTIEEYKKEEKAIIFKKETPYIIKNNKYYFLEKSNVDYHGIMKGRYICFEAKSTKVKNINWSSLKQHQLDYLELIAKYDGISFIIIFFETKNKYFLIFIKQLLFLKNNNQKINIETANNYGHEIFISYPIKLDFLKIINKKND